MEGKLKYDAIIFDMDGVLLHTDHYHYLSWKQVADKYGIAFDEQAYAEFRGVSRMDCLQMLLRDYNRPLTQQQKLAIADEKNQLFKGYVSQMTKNDVTDEVRQTLKKLKDLGIKMAVGSSSKNGKEVLRQTQLTSHFDAICDGNDIVLAKPNPQVFIKAAQMLNVKCDRALIVEDAVAGIQAGICGGFHTVAIGDARNHSGAEFRISSFAQLLDIVNQTK